MERKKTFLKTSSLYKCWEEVGSGVSGLRPS